MPTESETERPVEDQRMDGSSDMLQSGVSTALHSEDHAGCTAAGIVLWTNDGRFLVGRGATKQEWSEPGGKRERGETARACASRELHEEMRLSADDLEIDWDNPSYDEQCKYTFFPRAPWRPHACAHGDLHGVQVRTPSRCDTRIHLPAEARRRGSAFFNTEAQASEPDKLLGNSNPGSCFQYDQHGAGEEIGG